MPGLIAGHVCFCGVDRRYAGLKESTDDVLEEVTPDLAW
jgi:hypothetical protein